MGGFDLSRGRVVVYNSKACGRSNGRRSVTRLLRKEWTVYQGWIGRDKAVKSIYLPPLIGGKLVLRVLDFEIGVL